MPTGAIRGESALAASWGGTATEIKADILEHGVDKRGVPCQHYGSESLDASTLLAAIFGFLPGEDERMRASVLAAGISAISRRRSRTSRWSRPPGGSSSPNVYRSWAHE